MKHPVHQCDRSGFQSKARMVRNHPSPRNCPSLRMARPSARVFQCRAKFVCIPNQVLGLLFHWSRSHRACLLESQVFLLEIQTPSCTPRPERCKMRMSSLNLPWNNHQRTSFPTFRRRYDDKHPYQHLPNHYAFLQRGYTSVCWQHVSIFQDWCRG